MNRKYFSDQELEDQFQKQGFVVVPFFSSEDIQAAQKLFASIKPWRMKTIYCNLYEEKEQKNKKVTDLLLDLSRNKAESYLQDCRLFGACFIAKKPNDANIVDLHQDWTIVDESQYRSLAIWIPLIDVDGNNGSLEILPGSHTITSHIRTFNLPPLYIDRESRNIEQRLKKLTIPAGHAVIYSQSIFHASGPNLGKQTRVAVNMTAIPNEATPRFHHVNEKKGIDAFEMPEGFHNYMIRALNKDASKVVSELKYIGRLDHLGEIMKKEEFLEALQQVKA